MSDNWEVYHRNQAGRPGPHVSLSYQRCLDTIRDWITHVELIKKFFNSRLVSRKMLRLMCHLFCFGWKLLFGETAQNLDAGIWRLNIIQHPRHVLSTSTHFRGVSFQCFSLRKANPQLNISRLSKRLSQSLCQIQYRNRAQHDVREMYGRLKSSWDNQDNIILGHHQEPFYATNPVQCHKESADCDL